MSWTPMPRAQGWRLFVRATLARAYPRLVSQLRQPEWLFFDMLMPLVSMAGYALIYRTLQAPPGYVGFAVVGSAMMAFWINVLWGMAAQLYMDKQTGNLPLYILCPAPLSAVLLGTALGGVLATSVRAGLLLVLGLWLFDVHLSVSHVPMLGAVFVLTLVALYGLGMSAASLFLLFGRGAWQMTQVLHEPIHFVSGLYFPIRSLGLPGALAASVLPLTLGVDALRQLMFEEGASVGLLPVRVELASLAVLAGVFLVGAWACLTWMERRAREDGSLLDRGD